MLRRFKFRYAQRLRRPSLTYLKTVHGYYKSKRALQSKNNRKNGYRDNKGAALFLRQIRMRQAFFHFYGNIK